MVRGRLALAFPSAGLWWCLVSATRGVAGLLRVGPQFGFLRTVPRFCHLASARYVSMFMGFFKKKKRPADADALTNHGLQCLEDGDTAGAVEAFAAAVQLDPEHGQAWFGKGCAHGELGQYQDAIHAYEQSVQCAGERASLPLYNLGNIYQELERFQEAARCFHRATQVDPTMADAWINLGRILDDSGQHDAAIECYDTALDIEPDDVTAWSNRGNSLRALERFEDALESYDKALEIDAEDLAACIGVGSCLIECGQTEQGLVALQEATQQTRHPLAMFELGTALGKTGQHEAAVTMFDTLIEHEFVSAEIWNNRAECLASLQQIDDSLKSFDSAIEYDAQFAPAWFGKARVLVNAERIDEARPVARRYAELADEEELGSPGIQELLRICGIEK